MRRIDTPDQRFHNGDPATQTRGTVISDWWLNTIQEELANVVITLGHQLNPDKANQLVTALKAAFAPKTHNQPWTSITNKPGTYPPDLHRHSWGQIDSKPATYPPSAHNQGWDTITGKPPTFKPSAHTQGWSTITGKPTTYPSSPHDHNWSEIQNPPAAYPPSDHTHPTSDISGLSQVPTGAILVWPDNNVPAGFFECDGSPYSRSTYSALYNVIGTQYGSSGSTTFKVPDLRGEFVRGWDHGRGKDPSRALGSAQCDAFQGHKHTTGFTWAQYTSTGPLLTSQDSDGTHGTGNPRSDGVNGTPRTAAETRPKNIAMIFIIKY